MGPRKGALHEPEEARALCWGGGRAPGTRTRPERLPGGCPARLDPAVCGAGKDGMSGRRGARPAGGAR